jgi:hypothetical protein
MKHEHKIIIGLSIICCLLIAGLVWGIFHYIGTIKGNEESLRRAEEAYRFNIALLEGKDRIIEELRGYRDRERNRLDRERELAEREAEIDRRERKITEREEQYNSRERARIDKSREIYRLIRKRESDITEIIGELKETIRRGEEIVEEIETGDN